MGAKKKKRIEVEKKMKMTVDELLKEYKEFAMIT